MNKDDKFTIIWIITAIVGFLLIACMIFLAIDSTSNTRQEFCERYDMDYIHHEFSTLSCMKIVDGKVIERYELLEKNGRMYLGK